MRSYREYWLWLGAAFLVLAPISAGVAFAYFTKIASYSLFANPWMTATFALLVCAFACFLGAIKGWPFPPWRKASFPDLVIDIRGMGNFATDHEIMPGFSVPANIVSFPVRITNRESEQDASLTPRLYARIKPGSWADVAEVVCIEPDFQLNLGVELKELSTPIRLEAGSVIGGSLVFEISRIHLGRLADPFDADIELEDHVSEKRVRVKAIMGKYEKSELVPSQGGVRFLPAETQPSQPHEESPPQAQENAEPAGKNESVRRSPEPEQASGDQGGGV